MKGAVEAAKGAGVLRKQADIERDLLSQTLPYANFSRLTEEDVKRMGLKKGGKVKSSASKRADGIAQRGKTKGRFV